MNGKNDPAIFAVTGKNCRVIPAACQSFSVIE